jgi:predicted RNA binding protein YcfA (HicA-like mRNA interferase family)
MELAAVTSLECIRALMRLGFTIRRQHGGSLALERPGRIVVVPLGKVLGSDALSLILLSARVAPDEFAEAVAFGGAGSGEHSLDSSVLHAPPGGAARTRSR